MSFPHLNGHSVLTLSVWKPLQRRVSRKANALDVAGPESEHCFERCLKIVADYGGAIKIHALFGDEWLFVSDPRALHHILVKEPHIFEEIDDFILSNKLVFGYGLISTLGEQHQRQRKMLNPVFSISNMRELLPIIQAISHQLKSILILLPTVSMVMHAIIHNFTIGTYRSSKTRCVTLALSHSLDCICEGVLGYHPAALDTGNENEYTEALRMLGSSISKNMLYRSIVPVVMRNFSPYWCKKIADWLTISWLPTQTMRDLRELRRIAEIMDSGSRNILQVKKAALMPSPMPSQSRDTSGGSRGKDIVSIMLKANASSAEGDRLSDAELLGQMKLPYDSLMNLPFLDAVVRETLRLYPSLPVLGRRTTAASVPLQFPVRSVSGGGINTISVAKHQTITISILNANHNQAVWGEDASEWKPERWLNSTQAGVKDGVRYTGAYSSMMTFLAGNRSCIGLKFAEMEIKDVLATLVSDIHFALPSEPDENGHVKEIYRKMPGFRTPVVKAPAGDGETPHLPSSLRLVRE
ncbi:cytochrome P450 [Suillus americanus]|nr:cytochrome P450 [Suillus americanus]